MFNWWYWLVETARDWSMLSMFLRLMIALVVGTIIGIDRELKRRSAGIKTHVLVCLGAAIVMMTSQYMMQWYGVDAADLGRMGAQVISGVGFLGVGTIVVTGKNQIRGLTTAAGLWTCACVGLAAGIGYIEGALMCLVFVVFTFKVLKVLDHWVVKRAKVYEVYIEFDSIKSVPHFREHLRQEGFKLSEFEISKSKVKGDGPSAVASIEIPDRKKRAGFMDVLREVEGVKFAEEL
jgi:putative Mg2+ transporter-C (MgtC) family protein